MLSPQESLEKIVEELSPFMQQYEKSVSFLRDAYEKTPELRKAFLETGIEYTKSQSIDEIKGIGEELSGRYKEYKNILDERVQCEKSQLSSVTEALVSVDKELSNLDYSFDPKFGIQTQNPRIYKINRKNPTMGFQGDDSPVSNRKYCVCNGTAHGDMVACDSFHAEGPWFHMDCVDCSLNPKWHWFCPRCTSKE